MPFYRLLLVCALLLSMSMPRGAIANSDLCEGQGCIAFPSDFGALNVRDFGAKGDGVHDDTQAFRDALSAASPDMGRNVWQNRMVYVPNGTYLVSETIYRKYEDDQYASGFWLIGQSKAGTIIRLKDATSGYQDKEAPKAVLYTSSKLIDGTPTSGNKDYIGKGEGNDAYMNFIENLTVDVGNDNVGAIGIDYLANNLGAIRNVDIRAPAGSGHTAISMTRKWPGPALLSHVSTRGFEVGIDIAQTQYGMTLDHVTIENPTEVGLRNSSNAVSANALNILGAPLAISVTKPKGLVVIASGVLDGQGVEGGIAIENTGYINASALFVKGYGGDEMQMRGVYHKGVKISDVDWALPIKDAPPVPDLLPADWVSVTQFGISPSSPNDATPAISKAFSSGAKVIYFPYGTYHISKNIRIPATVERIIGMTAVIRPMPQRAAAFKRHYGMFRVEAGLSPLTIEKMVFDHTDLGRQVAVEVLGARDVVLRDIAGLGVKMVMRQNRGGEVFLENICCGPMEFKGSKGVWGRQINTEGGGVRIINQGAPLWMLGVKAERYNTLIHNRKGGVSEMMGGLVYIVQDIKDKPIRPAFVNEQGAVMRLAFVEESFSFNSAYLVYLQNHLRKPTSKLFATEFPPRRKGHIVPYLSDPKQ